MNSMKKGKNKIEKKKKKENPISPDTNRNISINVSIKIKINSRFIIMTCKRNEIIYTLNKMENPDQSTVNTTKRKFKIMNKDWNMCKSDSNMSNSSGSISSRKDRSSINSNSINSIKRSINGMRTTTTRNNIINGSIMSNSSSIKNRSNSCGSKNR
uniref:Uncharacterized protein n=1 Tax=Cacopsylla melanoneura TaxID=428564 RepID=A0A8D8Z8H8_9HEMI